MSEINPKIISKFNDKKSCNRRLIINPLPYNNPYPWKISTRSYFNNPSFILELDCFAETVDVYLTTVEFVLYVLCFNIGLSCKEGFTPFHEHKCCSIKYKLDPLFVFRSTTANNRH